MCKSVKISPVQSIIILNVLLGCSVFLKTITLIFDPLVGRDASLYLLTAQKWFDTCSLQLELPPMLFFLMKSLMHLGFPADVAGWTVNVILGSLITLIGFGITFELTGNRKIALIAAAFFALHPGINDLSIEIQRDIPFLFFAGCSIWTAFAGIKRKHWWLWSLCGIALSFALLTRYEALELLFLIAVWLFILPFFRRLSWKQIFGYGFTFILSLGFCTWLMLGVMNCTNFEKMWDAKFKKIEHQMQAPSPDREI